MASRLMVAILYILCMGETHQNCGNKKVIQVQGFPHDIYIYLALKDILLLHLFDEWVSISTKYGPLQIAKSDVRTLWRK